VTMTTETKPHEDHHTFAVPDTAGNWLTLIAPDGKVTVARMPPPADEWVEFYKHAYRNIPTGATPRGVLVMSRGPGPGAGGVNIHNYSDDGSISREELVKLKPLVWSRWSARVHAFGETRYEENFPGLFGPNGEPAIIRSGPEIGEMLAASCAGKATTYPVRPAGLRCGGPADMCLVGFIESAEADEYGVVATLLILRPDVHHDPLDLDATGDLESARLCLSHSASAIPRQRVADCPVCGAAIMGQNGKNGWEADTQHCDCCTRPQRARAETSGVRTVPREGRERVGTWRNAPLGGSGRSRARAQRSDRSG
jgi:hypothetical protein